MSRAARALGTIRGPAHRQASKGPGCRRCAWAMRAITVPVPKTIRSTTPQGGRGRLAVLMRICLVDQVEHASGGFIESGVPEPCDGGAACRLKRSFDEP